MKAGSDGAKERSVAEDGGAVEVEFVDRVIAPLRDNAVSGCPPTPRVDVISRLQNKTILGQAQSNGPPSGPSPALSAARGALGMPRRVYVPTKTNGMALDHVNITCPLPHKPRLDHLNISLHRSGAEKAVGLPQTSWT